MISSYNDPKGARTTTESLSNQLYEKHEIFHVNNNSTNKTGDVIQGYAESITAYHPARDSLAELRSKAQRIGRGRAQMRHYHSEIGDYTHPLHPTRFLPPSPWRLRDRYSGTSVSASEMIGFYALEYGLKLTQSANALREAVAIRWGE
nr:glycosyltransferase [Natronorubrum halophilum]